MSIEERLSRIETLLERNQRVPQSDLIFVPDVAHILKITESRVRHLVADREIPHYRNEKGQVSFSQSEVEAWRRGSRVPTKAETDQQATTYNAIRNINQ